MPDYSFNWTTSPVLYKVYKGVNDATCLSALSLPLLPDGPVKKPVGIKANSKLMPSVSSSGCGPLFVSVSHQTGLDSRLMTRRSEYSGD